MATKNLIEIIIDATDKASPKLHGLTGALNTLAKGAAVIGGAFAVAKIANMAIEAVKTAASVDQLRNTFNNLANSIGVNSDAMLNQLRTATSGMVADQGLFVASNKFVAMGLAKTAEEAATLTQMATQLGMAMGRDATEAAEDFAMMLANQSILRLDNFGISSGKVRERIEELMAANKNLTREQAFLNAVMEFGKQTMDKVGDQSKTTAGTMAQLSTSLENLKVDMASQLLPVIQKFIQTLIPLISSVAPTLIRLMDMIGGILATSLLPAFEALVAGLMPVLEALLPVITESFALIADVLMGTVIPSVLQIITALLPLIKTILPPLIELSNQFSAILLSLLTPVMSELISLVANLIIALMPLIELALPLLTIAFQLLSAMLSTVVVPIVKTVAEWVGTKLGGAVKDLAGWLSRLLFGAIGLVKGAIDSLVEKMKVVYDWVLKLGGRIKGFFDTVLNAIRSVSGVKTPSGGGGGGGGGGGHAGGGGVFEAAGGLVSRGSPYVVGERGPELFIPDGNGRILSNYQSNKALGGSGTVINVSFPNMTLFGSESDIEWQLKPAIMKVMREVMPNARLA